MIKTSRKTKRTKVSKQSSSKGLSLFHLPFWLVIACIILPFFIISNIVLTIVKWRVINTRQAAKINWKKANFSHIAPIISLPPIKTHVSFKKMHAKVSNFFRIFVP